MANQPRIAQLKVLEFSKEGQGRGIWHSSAGQPQLVEVPFSMPGDEVKVCLLKKKKGVYQSQLLEWLHFSENRISPRCCHFGYCGGCRWQHLAYEEQLKQKENWIYHYLQPFFHSDTVQYPIIPCLSPWYYRNKMEFTFSTDKASNRYLGLILYGTRGHVFQLQECYLMHNWIIDAIKAVTQWWVDSGLDAYHMGNNQGSLRTLVLREGQRTGDRMVMLTVSGNPAYALKQHQINHFVSAIRQAVEPSLLEQKLSIFLRIQQITKGKPTQFYEMLLYGPDHIREVLHIEVAESVDYTLNFRISPSAFFQPNTYQAEQIYSRAIQLSQISAESVVYDLYCGAGALGICVAKVAKQVVGIELSPESSLDARENVKYNHLSNVSIHTGDVGHLLPVILKDKCLHPDAILVDPPRAGLDFRALQHLINIKAPILTYISCNPSTQISNIKELINIGYRLQAVQPIDQFPQTAHVENIVVLTL